MPKIELPQPGALVGDEAAVEETTPGRPGATLDTQPARSQMGPAFLQDGGVQYRRTFACASSTEELDEPAKS